MRGPIIFLCAGGNIEVFRDGAHAASVTEPVDVQNGEYGVYGWDAEGRPMTLEARLPSPRLLEKLFGPVSAGHGEVKVRELDAPAEPDVLRSILLKFWMERDPVRAATLSSSSLEDLVTSVRPFINP